MSRRNIKIFALPILVISQGRFKKKIDIYIFLKMQFLIFEYQNTFIKHIINFSIDSIIKWLYNTVIYLWYIDNIFEHK